MKSNLYLKQRSYAFGNDSHKKNYCGKFGHKSCTDCIVHSTSISLQSQTLALTKAQTHSH